MQERLSEENDCCVWMNQWKSKFLVVRLKIVKTEAYLRKQQFVFFILFDELTLWASFILLLKAAYCRGHNKTRLSFFSWWRIIFLTKIFSRRRLSHSQNMPHTAPHTRKTPHTGTKLSSGWEIFVKRENLRQENITDFGFSCDLDNM